MKLYFAVNARGARRRGRLLGHEARLRLGAADLDDPLHGRARAVVRSRRAVVRSRSACRSCPGLIEVITPESSAPGERHAGARRVRRRDRDLTPGRARRPTRRRSTAACAGSAPSTWVPYQKNTFVTPAFAAYTSGHSTFSRAAAEVLTRFTGSAVLPRRARRVRRAGATLPEVRARADDRCRAAVGDLLRRRRPGGPVAHLGRHPHPRRRLRRPPHGLDDRGERVRQGAHVLGAGCQRHRRPEPDTDAGGEHDRRRGDADVHGDRRHRVADAVAAAAGRLRPAESARCAAARSAARRRATCTPSAPTPTTAPAR